MIQIECSKCETDLYLEDDDKAEGDELCDECTIEKLQDQNKVYRDAYLKLREACEFYGEPENYRLNANYNLQGEIMGDAERLPNECGCRPVCQCPSYGGKRARLAIKEVNEILKAEKYKQEG